MVKTKPVITQEMVLAMLQATIAKAEELQIKINVSVADDGGNLRGFMRMDDAPLMSGEIAQNKAYTAAAFGMPTSEWYPMIEKVPALMHGIVHTNRLVVFGGGIPLRIEGQLVGGIGVSGGTAEEDEACAEAGVKVMEKFV